MRRTDEHFRRRVKKRILNAQHGLCALCGYDLSKAKRYDVDHIVPLILGGKNEIENCRVLCRQCHKNETNRLNSMLKSRRNQFNPQTGMPYAKK